jgi:hypothetical protein
VDEQQGEVTPPVTPAAAVVELLGRDGRAVLVQRVTHWPVRIGRSPACDIVLDDSHIAAAHAELHLAAEGGVAIRLLDSRNGATVAGKKLQSGDDARLPKSGQFQLAGNVLRLRTSDDDLAPEQLLIAPDNHHWAVVPALLLLMLALQWLNRWSAIDPGARWIDYAVPLLGPLAFVLGWAGLWSLASQLFQHRFPFAAHLRRALIVVCIVDTLDWVLPGIAYALSWPRLMVLESLLSPAAGAFLVAWHARLVWPGATRILGVGIAALLVLGLGLQVGGRQEQQYIFGPPYLSSLPPPALRLVAPKPPEDLIEALKPLKAELQRQARKDNDALDGDESGGE